MISQRGAPATISTAKAGRYRQFWQAVKAAEGEAEVRAVAIIQKKMPDDWRAAMTYLERKHPQRWGRRVEVTNNSAISQMVDTIVENAERAKEAGDEVGVAAALDALDRMHKGEDPQAVYAEWLAAQRPPVARGGSGDGR